MAVSTTRNARTRLGRAEDFTKTAHWRLYCEDMPARARRRRPAPPKPSLLGRLLAGAGEAFRGYW